MPTIPDNRGRYYEVAGTEAKCMRCRRVFTVADVADGAEPGDADLVLNRMARELESAAGKHRCMRLRSA
ncbi:MAG: hypothetical protein L0212_00745 [Acidobacteria bacterium]|nr:hypothetical protein [Acidobacteriota bacterium]